MRHTTVFDTHQPLIYHICTALNPKVCILCHITSYTTPSASFYFDQTSTRFCFQMQLQNKHRQYETHDRLRYTPAPYIHICTALNPKVCILCHITSYTTPSASFNFDQTSTKYCFQMQLQNKHRQYETHDRLRYTPAPYIPHMYSFKAKSMHFMSYNFLYDPLSLFQFRSNFNKILLLDVASK